MYFFDFETYSSKFKKNYNVKLNTNKIGIKSNYNLKGISKDEYYVSDKHFLLSFNKFRTLNTGDIETPTRVVGYVYEIDEKTLKELDIKNGYPYTSDRRLINVILEGNDEFELSVEAYCYFIF